MKMFEYTKKSNFEKLDADKQKFVAKKIMQEVKQIAIEKNISEEQAYNLYSKGLYGADRDIG